MRVTAYALLLALIVGTLAALQSIHRPVYAFDGYVYGIRAQMDAGIPYERALNHARAVYAPTPGMQRPGARRWLASPRPQWWRLFTVRVVYPWLASLLWRHFDFASLFIVSALAYLASALLTYGMLLRIARPQLAAAIALLIALLPQSRVMARSDLTDMTAYAFEVGALWAMMAFLRSGGYRRLACAALLCAALSFTRPIPYAIVCAALPALLTRPWRSRGLMLAAIGVVLCAAVELAMNAAHADVPSTPGYVAAFAHAAAGAIDWWVTHPMAPIALALLLVRRREPEALIALGLLLAIPVSLALDPISGDVARVVLLPAFAPLACGLAYVAQALSPTYRATSAARLRVPHGRNTRRQGDHPWTEIQTNVS